jgi:hypothetical protein
MNLINLQEIKQKINIGKLKCKIIGCNFQKVNYIDPHYETWICINCGNVIKARKRGYYEGN